MNGSTIDLFRAVESRNTTCRGCFESPMSRCSSVRDCFESPMRACSGLLWFCFSDLSDERFSQLTQRCVRAERACVCEHRHLDFSSCHMFSGDTFVIYLVDDKFCILKPLWTFVVSRFACNDVGISNPLYRINISI